MLRLVYVSQSERPLREADLEDILRVSQRNNQESAITGLLLYEFASFMQLLEGPRQRVEALMARVRRDARHTNVKVLLREEAKERYFGAWSMGFSKQPALRRRDRALVSRLLDRAVPPPQSVDPSEVRRLTRAFQGSVRRYV